MKLERLYKTAKTGATQVFDITVSGDTYTVEWGQLDGKMQTKSTTCEAMNVGRSNESTPEQQAITEAKAVWTKKCKSNYSTSPEAPVMVNLPMKVENYHDFKDKVVFPCFTSVKLNGVNGEYRMVNGELVLLSRGGETYPIPAHQRDEVIALMKHLGLDSLNGEMYKHGAFLQDIMAATKKNNALTPELIFNIFDFPTAGGTYNDRCTKYYGLAQQQPLKTLNLVNVGVAYDHDDLDQMHADAVHAGYEGIIIRNPKGMYEYNTRSRDVLKYKLAQDAEFKVIDYNIDKNGHVVFVALTADGDSFKVKLKGTNEERLLMAANATSYLGKFLKVEFEMLSKDGVPQKPVGIMFRKVDANGEAIE